MNGRGFCKSLKPNLNIYRKLMANSESGSPRGILRGELGNALLHRPPPPPPPPCDGCSDKGTCASWRSGVVGRL